MELSRPIKQLRTRRHCLKTIRDRTGSQCSSSRIADEMELNLGIWCNWPPSDAEMSENAVYAVSVSYNSGEMLARSQSNITRSVKENKPNSPTSRSPEAPCTIHRKEEVTRSKRLSSYMLDLLCLYYIIPEQFTAIGPPSFIRGGGGRGEGGGGRGEGGGGRGEGGGGRGEGGGGRGEGGGGRGEGGGGAKKGGTIIPVYIHIHIQNHTKQTKTPIFWTSCIGHI